VLFSTIWCSTPSPRSAKLIGPFASASCIALVRKAMELRVRALDRSLEHGGAPFGPHHEIASFVSVSTVLSFGMTGFRRRAATLRDTAGVSSGSTPACPVIQADCLQSA